MNLLWTLVIGPVAGAVAKFLMPGKDPGGIFITMGLGVDGTEMKSPDGCRGFADDPSMFP